MRKNTQNHSSIIVSAFFGFTEIDNIFNIIKTKISREGCIKNGTLDKTNKSCKLCQIPVNVNTSWIYEKLTNLLQKINKYWNFQISSIGECSYVEYSNNDKFDWHIDIGPGNFNRKK